MTLHLNCYYLIIFFNDDEIPLFVILVLPVIESHMIAGVLDIRHHFPAVHRHPGPESIYSESLRFELRLRNGHDADMANMFKRCAKILIVVPNDVDDHPAKKAAKLERPDFWLARKMRLQHLITPALAVHDGCCRDKSYREQ